MGHTDACWARAEGTGGWTWPLSGSPAPLRGARLPQSHWGFSIPPPVWLRELSLGPVGGNHRRCCGAQTPRLILKVQAGTPRVPRSQGWGTLRLARAGALSVMEG